MSQEHLYSEEEAEKILRLAAEQPQEGVSRERLLAMAAEIGIPASSVERAEEIVVAGRQEEADRKEFERRRARKLRDGLSSVVLIGGGCVVINIISDGYPSWGLYVLGIMAAFWLLPFVKALTLSPATREEEFQEWQRLRSVRVDLLKNNNYSEMMDRIVEGKRLNRLEAIRDFRDVSGLGLAESKEIVDQYSNTHPGKLLH